MESCCEEIKNKLDLLDKSITFEFAKLGSLIISDKSSIESQVDENFNNLISIVLDTKQINFGQLNARLDTIQTLINQTNTFNKITERLYRI